MTRCPPRRRWFQFSLATLFVAVTVAAFLLWLGAFEWLVVLAMWLEGTKC